jgi:6-phosphogluconolactonase
MLVWKSCLVLLCVIAVSLSAVLPAFSEENKAGKAWVYIGTYTGPKSKGVYRLEMDLATGKLSEPELAGEAKDPSFLALHPTGRFLYAASEGASKTGGVKAFAIDRQTGNLSPLNEQPSRGAAPCHVVVDKAGKNVLVANYTGGSAAVLPIMNDGSLGEPTGFTQHKGSSVDPARQKEPHAHSINLDAANHFAFVADLGLDQVLVYRFDPAKGTITPNDPPFVAVAPGAGPRHFAFHPNGKFAYVINEMGSTVTALSYDAEKGVLKAGQSVTTLPADFKGNTSTAEVVVHPSGQFLYGSNRGHDSIAIFKIDPDTGKLTAVGHQGMGIKTPRNFNIDPTGKFMIVANQDGNSLVVFAIDQKTGELTPTGQKVVVANPVCVKFLVK